ncbi:hypothetical protein COOONC_27385 [Cooperia oncophora]
MANELEIEKQKTDELLCELMPASIADALRQGKMIEASDFSDCTLLFTDIVTFTNICAKCTPYDVVTLLNDLYLRFDRLIELVCILFRCEETPCTRYWDVLLFQHNFKTVSVHSLSRSPSDISV